MNDSLENPIVQFFFQYAYEPLYVYSAIVVLMFASSFGLPFPEELTLLSAGLLAHIGSNPDLYAPPYPDAPHVDTAVAATVCFFSVFLSDLLVFSLGRFFGPKIRGAPLLRRLIKPEMWTRIDAWTTKYGIYACGIFRFTPALRFPGHFTCGSLGIPFSKFILVDGLAALLTVPTQVVLMALYGDQVLGLLKNVKLIIGTMVILAIVLLIVKRRRHPHGSSDDLDPSTHHVETARPQNNVASDL